MPVLIGTLAVHTVRTTLHAQHKKKEMGFDFRYMYMKLLNVKC